MKFENDICLICFEPLDGYACADQDCYRQFEYEDKDDRADFCLGDKYIIEYIFDSDRSFKCAKVFSRPYGKHVCDFPEPFNFQEQTTNQIIQRIKKLEIFQ